LIQVIARIGIAPSIGSGAGGLIVSQQASEDLKAKPAGMPIAALVRAHPLAVFIGLTYGYSWAELALLGGILHAPAALTIGLTTFASTVAAITVAAVTEGRGAVIELFRPLMRWGFGWRWYAFVLALLPAAYLAATGAIAGAPASPPHSISAALVTYLVVFAITCLIGGPLGEEPGWRGFALPRLQARFGPLTGAIILGALWGPWHLPQYLVGDWAAQNGGVHPLSVGVFLAVVVAISIVLAWIWNVTRGSLPAVILAHTSINASQIALVDPLFPNQAGGELGALIGFGALAALIVVVTRGRLGMPLT